MEFDSAPSTSKGIAIFCGAFAFVMGYFSLFVASGAGAAVLAVLSVVGAIAAWLVYGARYVVMIDKTRGTAEKLVSTTLYRHVRRFNLQHYSGVGIGVGGRSAGYANTAVYFVQLLGTQNLDLLPSTPDIATAKTQAREIADYLDFSLDDHPRTVAFGRRL